MILHFVLDEKIVDQVIENFLEVSPDNLFLVFSIGEFDKYKHISKVGSHIKRFNSDEDDINKIVESISPQLIVLHSLNFSFANTINKLKYRVKIAWVAWGYDVYHLPKIRPRIYANKTRKSIKSQHLALYFEEFVKKHRLLRSFYYKIIKAKCDYFSEIEKSFNKIDFFLTNIKGDYSLFNEHYKSNIVHHYYLFNTINQYIAYSTDIKISNNAKNILIGNSNTYESNYLDVLPIVSRKKNELNKVFVVLSYGEDSLHKQKVLNAGRALLNSQFHPLLTFMSRSQYVELLSSCSVGIFYHYRQQAVGNIIAMLYLGARVYLSKKNPVFEYLKSNNISVFELDDEFDKYGTKMLSTDLAKKNKRQLSTLFSKKNVLDSIRNIISLADNVN